jgi:hypothetical protein
MTLTPQQLVNLGRQVQTQQIKLIGSTTNRVTALWDQMPGIGDDAMTAFAREAAAAVEQAQTLAARNTVAFLAQAEGMPAVGSGVSIADVVSEARPGVLAVDVYERPVVTVRTALAEGKTFARARDLGRLRLIATVDTDIALASREAGRQYASTPRSKIRGYRRLPSGNACNFCLMACTQRYRHQDLMPLHTSCHCTLPPVPIVGDVDPGRVIDKDALRQLKESGKAGNLSYQSAIRRSNKSVALAEKRLSELRDELASEEDSKRVGRLEDRIDSWNDRKKEANKLLERRKEEYAAYKERMADPVKGYKETVSVRQHGELGPVLTRKGDNFAGF